MRIFGLTPGRAGSMTLARALSHATNYTSAHESRNLLAPLTVRLDYPNWHAEIDRHLALMLGALEERFPDDVLYVHATREPDAVVASWVKRMPDAEPLPVWFRKELGLLLKRRHRLTLGYAIGHTLFGGAQRLTQGQMTDAASAYVEMIEANIRLFLRDRPFVEVNVDDPTGLAELWERGGIEGDFDAALAEYEHRHNAS